MKRGRVRRLAHALRTLLTEHPLIIVGIDGTVVDLGFLVRDLQTSRPGAESVCEGRREADG